MGIMEGRLSKTKVYRCIYCLEECIPSKVHVDKSVFNHWTFDTYRSDGTTLYTLDSDSRRGYFLYGDCYTRVNAQVYEANE